MNAFECLDCSNSENFELNTATFLDKGGDYIADFKEEIFCCHRLCRKCKHYLYQFEKNIYLIFSIFFVEMGANSIHMTLPDRCFDYLRPKGEIICRKCNDLTSLDSKLELKVGLFLLRDSGQVLTR